MLPRRIQWLAAIAGCVTGIALVGSSWILSFAAIPLVVAAILLSWFPRAGRWVIFATALLLIVMVLPPILANPLAWFRGWGRHDFNLLAMSLSWPLSAILLGGCVTAVAIDLVKQRRSTL